MNPLFPTVALAVAGTVTLAGLPALGAQHEKPDEKPGVVTILTAPEAETQLMAMTLTLQAIQQGAPARVLLCGPAGDIALKEAPASATRPQKPAGISPQEAMKKIIEAGAPVEVCAIYLPNRELPAEALIEGVGQARPDAMAGHLIAPDTRILSF
jgi:hypothetical protein